MSGRRARLRRAAGWLVVAALCAAAPRGGAERPAAAADDALVVAARTDGWVVYPVPLAVGAGAPCCYSGWRGGKLIGRVCALDGEQRGGIYGEIDGPGMRSTAQRLLVHLRFEDGALREVLAVGDDCPVDAGGAPLRVLTGVSAERSAERLLAAALDGDRRSADRALHALSLHDRVGTDTLLAVARDPAQPRTARRQAFFWLGQSDDPRALAEIAKVLER